MVSFGRLLKIPYLLCSNHSIHLAVTDKIFTKKNPRTDVSPNGESDSNEETDEESEHELEMYDIAPVYHETIKKMRFIIKIFRYSPLKAGVLETVQKNEGKKPLKLIHDVVTRWNSLVLAGKRFLEILPSVKKALNHKDIRADITWLDSDTKILEEVVNILDPARVATETLSDSKINLLVGEGILKFLMSETHAAKAEHPESHLAKNFLEALKNRFQQRRNSSLNTLILYLSNHDVFKNEYPLDLTSKSIAVKFGIDMMKRLFSEGDETSCQLLAQETQPTSANIYDRLKTSIGSVQHRNFQQNGTAADPYKKSFEQFDRQHVRGPELDKLFEALMCIQPTSTQAERNFSLAAGIATAKRSRMAPEKLNALCFLKSYFKLQKETP